MQEQKFSVNNAPKITKGINEILETSKVAVLTKVYIFRVKVFWH